MNLDDLRCTSLPSGSNGAVNIGCIENKLADGGVKIEAICFYVSLHIC